MERAYTHGLMAENMMDFMLMIKNKVLVCILGQMEEHMKDIGLMENSMVRVNSLIQKAKVEQVSGKTEIVLNG